MTQADALVAFVLLDSDADGSISVEEFAKEQETAPTPGELDTSLQLDR